MYEIVIRDIETGQYRTRQAKTAELTRGGGLVVRGRDFESVKTFSPEHWVSKKKVDAEQVDERKLGESR